MRRLLILCVLLPGVALGQPLPTEPAPTAPPPVTTAPRNLNTPWPPVPPAIQSAPPSTPPPPGAPLVPLVPEVVPAQPDPLGWYLDIEHQLLFAKIDGQIGSYVPIGRGFITPVILPNAKLDTGSSNQFGLGYRFGPDLGGLFVSYRSQAARGRELYTPLNGFDGEVTSRLDTNVLNVSYLAPQIDLGEGWAVDWSLGGRLGTSFFDSQAISPYMDQSSSNFFIGAGPTGSAGISKRLAPNWSVFGNVDYGLLFGRVTQQHRYALIIGNPIFGYTENRSNRSTHQLSVQAGFDYHGPNVRLGGLKFGYQFEEWLNIGNLGPSRADLITHGLFVRWQLQF